MDLERVAVDSVDRFAGHGDEGSELLLDRRPGVLQVPGGSSGDDGGYSAGGSGAQVCRYPAIYETRTPKLGVAQHLGMRVAGIGRRADGGFDRWMAVRPP